ncbi:SMI1/KNR4 family protein [Methylocella sp. CPCC 101449]|uniref:SMI1/KNR4 family protein n=1 Tax=Methylocella sp. CPCC 101449 TaxID=2987531 RepID=UPI00288C6C0C|nr:SMI1/KNR4 family protein [Methylocella sp. CPCC 101449]MDT2024142.1 SMI1/KNR4 family protein [Methylocella sp. CPCC 101449]
MYFAKFFHKAPSDDRLLLYTPDVLMGIYARKINYADYPNGRPSYEVDGNLFGEFLRKDYPTTHEGVSAYRDEAEKLRQSGYVETHHTEYTLRDLEGDDTPKPDWQKALDEVLLAMFADPVPVQAQCIAALKDTPAENEPVALWARAHYASATGAADALALCEQARDGLWACKAAGTGFYTWSLRPRKVEAYVLELLCRRTLMAGDAMAALTAIEQALEAEIDTDRTVLRANILCDHFPEREEDAFDDIYRYIHFGHYTSITSRPSFASYAARRAADTAAKRASWRWSLSNTPANAAAISEAEHAFAGRFPDDYRAFLKTRGKSVLFVRAPHEDASLHFHAPEQLAQHHADVVNFLTMTESVEEAADAFREEYGVSLAHLIPIAEPNNASNALLLHIEPGDNYGHVYVWNHDGAFELVYEQNGFDEMMRALLDGIEEQDAGALDLFNIRPDTQ